MIFRFDADGKIAEIKNNRADDRLNVEMLGLMVNEPNVESDELAGKRPGYSRSY